MVHLGTGTVSPVEKLRKISLLPSDEASEVFPSRASYLHNGMRVRKQAYNSCHTHPDFLDSLRPTPWVR